MNLDLLTSSTAFIPELQEYETTALFIAQLIFGSNGIEFKRTFKFLQFA